MNLRVAAVRKVDSSRSFRAGLSLVVLAAAAWVALPAQVRAVCVVPDNGGGTATMLPVGFPYITPSGDMQIINGLPPGTTIDIDASLTATSTTELPGGSLGGNVQNFGGFFTLPMIGTGSLAGYNRVITMPGITGQSQSVSRTPGVAIQSFGTDMFQLQGQLPPGDPDFDLLRITAGSGFGMPSPGHTTLTRQPSTDWAVDSFFDITYRIDFVGAPGGPLAGQSGSTTGTARFDIAPEPSTLALALAALGVGLCVGWRKSRAKRAA
jgi:hypothetical protein